ncbi:MAG: hypothetical protein JWM10_4832 [Myxococcaceae bacterium]|nr:hypothetical protein [Myxococcaceae bacterium]
MAAYDERAVVLAYVDAQRPPYPHENFRRFRQQRLRALEQAYGIRVSLEGAKAMRATALWMLFDATVNTYLGLKDPRSAFLEAGLIESKIDGLGAAGREIRAVEERLYAHLQGCREAHVELLTRLFVHIWGPIGRPLGPGDLAAYSFDESAEPKLSDYYDDM